MPENLKKPLNILQEENSITVKEASRVRDNIIDAHLMLGKKYLAEKTIRKPLKNFFLLRFLKKKPEEADRVTGTFRLTISSDCL